jgi:membrane fusion protein (multidrug efflux system)
MAAMHRASVVGCAVMLLVAGCGGDGAKAGPGAVDVIVAPVQVRDVPIIVEWAAQTFGANDVEIRARVKGFMTQKAYKEGSLVRRGDLLFQIDPQEYQTAVAQARAAMSEAQANLSKTNADVARLTPLVERNAVSRQDLDHAIAAKQGAEGQVAAARAVLNTAQLNLGYTKVTSPITGLAGVAQADVGSLVGSPGPTLLTVVSQVDTLKVKFRISEQEYLILRRALGDSAPRAARREGRLELVLADGSVFDHKGTVVTVDRNIDPTTGHLASKHCFRIQPDSSGPDSSDACAHP